MSKKPERHSFGVGYAALATIGLLALTAVLLFVFADNMLYTPFFLPALVLLLPASVNLLLLIPLFVARARRGVKAPDTVAPDASADTVSADTVPPDALSCVAATENMAEVKAPASLKKRGGRGAVCGACAAVGRFLARYRALLLTVAVLAVTVTVNLFFWRFTKQEPMSTLLSLYAAVAMLAASVLFAVLGKWCKHQAPDKSEEGTHARYEVALMRNLQAASVLAAVVTLLVAVTVALRVLGVYDFSTWLVVIMAAVMIYQTVFYAISLFVLLVRREMSVAPEIMAPVPGLRYGSIGVLDYLEKNTGISMRSLWSIRFIGHVVPYAFLLSLLVLWLGTGVVMIDSNQQGAHYHLGKLGEEPLEPGLHVTLPWPFDEVRVFDTETVNKITVGYVTEGTGDNLWTEAHGSEEYRLLVGGGKELVSINLKVEYRIGDLHRYLTCTGAPELLLSATSYEIVTAHTIGSDLDTLLSVDRTVFSHSFKEALVAQMERFGTGLEIVSVVLESIHPPIEVAEAYQALNSAHIDAERMEIEAKAYAFERLAWAQISYDTAVALANIKKAEAVGNAEAALAEFMASVEADKSNTDAYRYYKYLQALTDAYAGAKLVIVGDGVNEGNIFIGTIGK